MLYKDIDSHTHQIHTQTYSTHNTTYTVKHVISEKYNKIVVSDNHTHTVNNNGQINQSCNICKLDTVKCIHKIKNRKIKVQVQNKFIEVHSKLNTNTNVSPIDCMNQENQRQTKCAIQVEIPSIFQLHSKQLPKIITDQIFTSSNTKLQNYNNSIKVDKICINPYLNQGELKWLLYQIPENCQPKIEVLYKDGDGDRNDGKITIQNINYFSNMEEYEQYFKFTTQDFEKLDGLQLSNTGQECRYILFGICQSEIKSHTRIGEGEVQCECACEQKQKKAKIIALYLWTYQWNNQEQKYLFCTQKRLKIKNRQIKEQMFLIKQQQNHNDNMHMSKHLQTDITYNQNIQNTAQIDNNQIKIPQNTDKIKQPKPQNNEIELFPCANILWQGNIDLQYKLRQLQNKLVCFQYPINSQPQPQPNKNKNNDTEDVYVHYLVRFQIKKAHTYMLVIYNRQKMCIDIYEYIQYLWNTYLSKNKRQMCGKQLNQLITRQLMQLEQPQGLAYPITYYLAIFYLYHNIQRYIMLDFNQRRRYENMMVENAQEERKQQIGISMQDKIKLCKYMLIQNVKLEEIFLTNNNNNNNNRRQLSEINSQIDTYQIQNRRISKILQLDNSLLQSNPINNTLIIYWIVGLPGALKTSVFSDIKLLLQPFSVSTLHLTDPSQKQKLQKFISSTNLFSNERFAFCFMDTYYSVEKMKQFTSMLTNILPHDVYYQLILISPQKEETTIFYSQIDTQYENKKQCIQNTYRKIQTTYHFSIDYMIGCLLNIQKKPYNKQHPEYVYGQGTESLAKMLHFISNNYSNMDLQKMVRKCHSIRGKIRILYYSTKQKVQIYWNSINQYEREEIQDQLKVLLQLSYKEVIQQDMLLAYFLENLQNLQYRFNMNTLADEIMDKTFQVLPYFTQESTSN